MKKFVAHWNKVDRTKSAEVINNVLKCQSCPPRWNPLHDSLFTLVRHKGKHSVTKLQLPLFKLTEIEFITKYVDALAPLAIVINLL